LKISQYLAAEIWTKVWCLLFGPSLCLVIYNDHLWPG